MRSDDLMLTRGDTLLVVVDVQERLVKAMEPELWAKMSANLERLGRSAALLGVPAILTEQYPQGLGHTVEQVRECFKDAPVFEKSCFDAAKDGPIAQAIQQKGARKIVVAGMETHVCVYQTVRSLARDHAVHVLMDAVASRTRANWEVGLDLARAAGGLVSCTETVLFDLLQKAGTEEFRAVSKLLK
jgi:nicotinamidase-related amidase